MQRLTRSLVRLRATTLADGKNGDAIQCITAHPKTVLLGRRRRKINCSSEWRPRKKLKSITTAVPKLYDDSKKDNADTKTVVKYNDTVSIKNNKPDDNGDTVQFVDRILAVRYKNQAKMERDFLIQWHGGRAKWGNEYQTWEPEINVTLQGVNEFFNQHLKSVDADTYVDSTDPQMKRICNDLFALSIEKFCGSKRTGRAGSILVLDSNKLTTAKLLQRKFGPFIAKDIVIPNPFIVPKKSSTFQIYNCSLSMLLHKLTDPSTESSVQTEDVSGFYAVWLDYCCSLIGSGWCNPREEIEYLFSQRLLNTSVHGSVPFAVTLSTRCQTDQTEWLVDSDHIDKLSNRQVIVQFIEECAVKHGYIAIFQCERLYKTMIFILFRIIRIL